MTELDINGIVALVNQLRVVHNVPPIKWNIQIAHVSQTYANTLAATNKFQHSNNYNYGENLFMSPGLKTNFQNAIKLWYNEIKSYNYNLNTYQPNCGHATALLWKNTTDIGAGIAKLPNGYYVYVMNFSPPGNYNKQFKQNVLPSS